MNVDLARLNVPDALLQTSVADEAVGEVVKELEAWQRERKGNEEMNK
jgi:hypothetical protein